MVFDYSEYNPFIKNLQRVQCHMFYSMDKYNNVIDFLNKACDEDTAKYIIDLCNDFYITGVES